VDNLLHTAQLMTEQAEPAPRGRHGSEQDDALGPLAAEAAQQGDVLPQVTVPDWGLFRLIFSDYRFLYRYKQETVRHSLVVLLPRLLLSPSLQFAILVRLCQRSPAWFARIVAYFQVMLFSSEVFAFHQGPGIQLGAAVAFPHPYGVMIGPGSVIGSRVSIYHHTMIGTDRRWFPGEELRPPLIGDDVVVGGASRVLGPFKIGEGAVIGLNVFVRDHVPPMSTLLLSGLKLGGEWSDPRLDGREPPPTPDLVAISPYAAGS
jgi:serine acetyltransferase